MGQKVTCLLQSTIQYHAAYPGSPRKAKCSNDIEAGKQSELKFPFSFFSFFFYYRL